MDNNTSITSFASDKNTRKRHFLRNVSNEVDSTSDKRTRLCTTNTARKSSKTPLKRCHLHDLGNDNKTVHDSRDSCKRQLSSHSTDIIKERKQRCAQKNSSYWNENKSAIKERRAKTRIKESKKEHRRQRNSRHWQKNKDSINEQRNNSIPTKTSASQQYTGHDIADEDKCHTTSPLQNTFTGDGNALEQTTDEMEALTSTEPLKGSILSTYRHNPCVAQHLHWETSGLFRFEYGDTEVRNKDTLLQEIKQAEVTQQEVRSCITHYKKHTDYSQLNMEYCGCCGIVTMSSTASSATPLSSLTCLQLTESEYNEWKSKPLNIRCLHSVFELDEAHKIAYHVIPDLVQANMQTYLHEIQLCHSCEYYIIKKKRAPRFSVATGFDFGCTWRSHLRELSIVEKCLISKVRVYSNIIKLRAPDDCSDNTRMTALKGHVIAMKHNGSVQTVRCLPHLTVDDIVVVYFIGSKDRWNNIRSRWHLSPVISERLQVRIDVVMDWLNVLRVVNPLYRDVPLLQLDVAQRDILTSIPNRLLQNAHVTEDETTLRIERQSSASTAPTVPFQNNVHMTDNVDETTVEDENERAVDTVFLNDFLDTSRVSTEVEVLHALSDKLTSIAKNLGPYDTENGGTDRLGVASHDISTATEVVVERQGDILNEFTQNDELLYGAFPWLYLFGKGVEGKGPLSKPYTSFVLRHFNKKFAQEHNFIFLLFNQMQRHAASRICSTRIYSSRKGVKSFMKTINSPAFDREMACALQNPSSIGAKRFLRKLLPNIRTTGSRVPFGPVERQESKYKLYASVQFFGCPSFFLTVTPNEINSPLCIRLCKRDGDNFVSLQDIQCLSVEKEHT